MFIVFKCGNMPFQNRLDPLSVLPNIVGLNVLSAKSLSHAATVRVFGLLSIAARIASASASSVKFALKYLFIAKMSSCRITFQSRI